MARLENVDESHAISRAAQRRCATRVSLPTRRRPALDEGKVRLTSQSSRSRRTTSRMQPSATRCATSTFSVSRRRLWGRMPVWGFAEVAAVALRRRGGRGAAVWLSADQLASHRFARAGERARVRRRRTAPARAACRLQRVPALRADPLYRADREAEQALLRPLFVTSFLIDDSSLTTIASARAACCCRAHRARPLTARRSVCSSDVVHRMRSGHRAHVAGQRRNSRKASDATTMSSLMTRWRRCLSTSRRCTSISLAAPRCAARSTITSPTGWPIRAPSAARIGTSSAARRIAGPATGIVLRAGAVKKRSGDWGRDGLQQRIAAAWHAFMARITDAHRPWLTVVRGSGPEAITATYLELLDGKTNPRNGHMLSP